MSDNVPQAPEEFNNDADATTQVSPAAAGAAAADAAQTADAAPTTQTPRVQVEPTPTEPDPVEENPTTEIPLDPPTERINTDYAPAASYEPVDYSAAPATETVRHTVVKTKTKKLPVFLSALAGLVLGALMVIAFVMSGVLNIGKATVSSTGSKSSGTGQSITINTSEDTTLAEAVSTKALPSVVSLTVTSSQSSSLSSLLGSSGDSETDSDSSGSLGSGVILDKEGNILTNYHVIEGGSEIVVKLSDGSSYEAEVVGTDESSDLAVVKLKDASDASLTPIEIGDSSDLNVGEWVMAIGSPFGNEQSVSTGIISALYRSTAMSSTSGSTIYANMIQTDAAINPGNSGGALVNSNGELIGINSLIESYSGSSSGVGFAIPVNYAKNIADQIIAGKTPVHPYLGVSLSSVNALNSRQNNLSTTSGAYVAEVTDGGPAATAGIQVGDIITKVDGEEVETSSGLIIALREHEVGDKVKLTIERDNKEQEVEVTLGSDEALQNTQEDDTTTDNSGTGLSDDQLREYLEELLNGYGQNGDSGNSDSGNSGNSGNGYGFDLGQNGRSNQDNG